MLFTFRPFHIDKKNKFSCILKLKLDQFERKKIVEVLSFAPMFFFFFTKIKRYS